MKRLPISSFALHDPFEYAYRGHQVQNYSKIRQMRLCLFWLVQCLFISSYFISSVEAVSPQLEVVLQDDFAQYRAERYQTSGDVTVNEGLRLAPKSSIYRDLAGSGVIRVRVDVGEPDAVGDWKLQLKLDFDGGRLSAVAQIVQSEGQRKVLLFGFDREQEKPEDLREFRVDSAIGGTWELAFSYGQVELFHADNPIGETAITASDQDISGVMLASLRGNATIQKLQISSEGPRPPLDSEKSQAIQEANALVAKAESEALFARHTKAVEVMQKAVSIYIRVLGDNNFRTAWAQGALGSYLTRTGSYRSARMYIEKSLETFTSILGESHVYTATSQLMLANLLIGVEDAEQGLPLAKRALDTAIRAYGENSPTVAAALTSYAAGSLKLGDVAETDWALRTALRIREESFGADNFHLTPYLIQLGEFESRHGNSADAKSLLDRAAAILTANVSPDHPDVLRVKRAIAEILLREGKFDEAIEYYQASLKNAAGQFGNEHWNIALLQHDLGIAYLKAGQIDKARAAVREALRIQVKNATDLSIALSETQTLRFVESVYQVRDGLLSIDIADTPHSQLESYADLAGGRSILTRVQLQASGRYEQLSPTAEVEKVVHDLRDVRSFLAGMTIYRGRMRNDDRIPALIDMFTKEKERLERRLMELQSVQTPMPMPDVSAILSQMPLDIAIVDIVLANVWTTGSNENSVSKSAQYYAFITRKSSNGTPYHKRLALGSSQEINKRTIKWLRAISRQDGVNAASSPDGERDADWIYSNIWLPIAKEIGKTKKLVVIPDGVFTSLPWAAIRSGKTKRFLLEDGVTVATILSLEHLAALNGPHEQSLAKDTLIVGNVNFGQASGDASRAIVVGESDEATQVSWRSLPGTAAEIQAVARLVPKRSNTKILSRSKATEQAVENAMSGALYIHLATHGFFAGQGQNATNQSVIGPVSSGDFMDGIASRTSRNPLLRNGIVLSGANDREPKFEPGTIRINDGILTAEELVGIQLNGTELVVLSACETGLGFRVTGEGSFGLQRTFLLSGARSVIGSLWKVDDAATTELMEQFYRAYWGKHKSKLEALRQAQLHIIHSRKFRARSNRLSNTQLTSPREHTVRSDIDRALPKRSSPYFWAAFTLSGDWR